MDSYFSMSEHRVIHTRATYIVDRTHTRTAHTDSIHHQCRVCVLSIHYTHPCLLLNNNNKFLFVFIFLVCPIAISHSHILILIIPMGITGISIITFTHVYWLYSSQTNTYARTIIIITRLTRPIQIIFCIIM